jgi:hypothetical protein
VLSLEQDRLVLGWDIGDLLYLGKGVSDIGRNVGD